MEDPGLERRLAEVAHELNNPAAAVRRGVAHLAEALQRMGALDRRLGALDLDEDEFNALADRARSAARSPGPADALDRSDAEDAIEAWLDHQDVPEPWDLAPALAAMGYDVPTLERLAAEPGASLPVLRWLAARHEIHSLLSGIDAGAARVASIAQGLKDHARPEPAAAEPVDIHQELEETLRILRGMLGDVEIRRDLAARLPEVQAYPGELGQVWTNLVDNAIYAMGGRGTLTLRTRATEDWVEVEVQDDGSGIPAEIQPRIFDPFFTTKGPDGGMGLGLDISRAIIADRHRGSLTFTSEPGRTTFTVRLPLGTGE